MLHSNILQAENAAFHEVEEMFIEAGWSDGWGLTDDEVRRAPSPLFYRNSAPVAASEAKITLGDDTHSLYCIYSLADNDTKYSGDRPFCCPITIALAFYYDEAFIFDSSNGNEFAKFMDALLSEAAERFWVVASTGEGDTPAADDEAPYSNRKTLFITKTF